MAPTNGLYTTFGMLAGVGALTAGAGVADAAQFPVTQEFGVTVDEPGDSATDDVEFMDFEGPGTLVDVLFNFDANVNASSEAFDGQFTVTFGGSTENTVLFTEEFSSDSGNSPQSISASSFSVITGLGSSNLSLEEFTSGDFTVFFVADAFGEDTGSIAGSATFTYVTEMGEVPLPAAGLGLLTGLAGIAGLTVLRRRG
ncbi:MAG: hypothetical protein AAFP17_00685 [Pseudomonadota bacterium]